MTDYHKQRNSLRILNQKPFNGEKKHESLRLGTDSKFSINSGYLTMFNSSNFRTKNSFPQLSNQLKSGSSGPRPETSDSIQLKIN